MAKQSFLKDESGEIFSPLVSTASIYDKNLSQTLGGKLDADLFWGSETIFYGDATSVSMNANSFNWVLPTNIHFDIYNGFVSGTGYVVPFDGLYEISVHMQYRGNSGGKSSNFCGYCVNKIAQDGIDLGVWQRQNYRLESCPTFQRYLVAGDSIQFEYYVDGSSSRMIDYMSMTIKLIHKNNYQPAPTAGNTNIKILKDENGEPFSPITNIDSCLLASNENIQEKYNRKTKLVAAVTYGVCELDTSVTDTINTKYFSSDNLVSHYENNRKIIMASGYETIPHFEIAKSGWYNVGVGCRVMDYMAESQDARIQIGYTTTSNAKNVHFIWGGRMAYRYGYSGRRTVYFDRGTIVYPRIWRDLSIPNLRYLNFYIEEVKLDDTNTPWTLSEATSFMQRMIDTKNSHKNNTTFPRDYLFGEGTHTDDYWEFYFGTPVSGANYVHFSKKNDEFLYLPLAGA